MAQGSPQPAVQAVVLQPSQEPRQTVHHLPQQQPAYSISGNWARIQPNNYLSTTGSTQIFLAQSPQQVTHQQVLDSKKIIFKFTRIPK